MKNIRVTIFFLLLLIAVFLLLGVRCFYLQHVKNDYYRKASTKQRQKLINQVPPRGAILDCRGRVLAASNKTLSIIAEPRRIKDVKTLSAKLQPILGIGAHEICKVILESKNPGYVKLKTDAGLEECIAAKKISAAIGVESNWRRHYPMGRLTAHVVGFTSSDNRGLEGLELKFDQKLRGESGRNVFFADSARRPIRFKKQKSMQNGVGLILTIDAAIQQFVRSELLSQYKNFEAESAVAIVAEARTGAILAMVSLPDFDPAERREGEVANYRNRAISDEFEPGSIIKPIVVAIGLDAGVVNKKEKIFCENGNYHGKGFGQIGEYRKGFGDLTLKEILINSSNIGMAKIGQRLGKKRLYKGLKHFGFGEKTKLDLRAEVKGVMRRPSEWTGYSVTRIPFGHEITVTAIQLVRAYCILANDGRVVRPFLVKAVVDNNGEIIDMKQSESRDIGFAINPEVARWVVGDAMAAVVNEGTGKRAKLERWQVFGKTGTANIAASDRKGYSTDSYVASFIAGAPADDPRIVVLVSIRKPNKKLGKGYTGGVVASPVAGKIIQKTLNYLENRR